MEFGERPEGRPPVCIVCYDDHVTFTESAASRLETIGFRSTAPRKAVLSAIEDSPGPFTVEDLLIDLPEVGRATVFRTIKLLQELDLVCRVPLEDGSVRYQLSKSEHHHHLVCRNCGKVTEFTDPEMDARIQEQANSHGFTLQGHSLELYGHCNGCQEA
jgi:Fur family ferric uptake transcriptional regulator